MNALFLFVGLGAVGIAGEVWLRRSQPFSGHRYPLRFVPGVGVLLEPNEEVRWTNLREFWTISRTNGLGFLDREPATPGPAAPSCHITLIGDSYVEAAEVEVSGKSQVRLEALAARERADLKISTSAFGRSGTGQVQQIPIYDAFVRPLRPRVVVLVASPNDYEANSGALWEVLYGPPAAELYATAERDLEGRVRLRLPDESSPAAREWIRSSRRRSGGRLAQLRSESYLWGRLERETTALVGRYLSREALWSSRRRWRRLADSAPALRGWRPPARLGWGNLVLGITDAPRAASSLPPVFAEALEMTAFALDEFAARAERDRFRLVLLLHESFAARGDAAIRAMADERGIPVIGQREYISSIRGDPRNARFPYDGHWTPTGHRWVAEALWRYLEEHPPPCGRATAGRRGAGGRGLRRGSASVTVTGRGSDRTGTGAARRRPGPSIFDGAISGTPLGAESA